MFSCSLPAVISHYGEKTCLGWLLSQQTLTKVLIERTLGMNQKTKMAIIVLEQECFISVVATASILCDQIFVPFWFLVCSGSRIQVREPKPSRTQNAPFCSFFAWDQNKSQTDQDYSRHTVLAVTHFVWCDPQKISLLLMHCLNFTDNKRDVKRLMGISKVTQPVSH